MNPHTISSMSEAQAKAALAGELVTDSPIAEFVSTEAALREIETTFSQVPDVTTKDGMAAARETRRSLVSLRTTVEAERVRLKAPLLERGRIIDAEAKRITERVVKVESPIDAAIKAEEARVEAEREAKRRAEEEAKRQRQRELDAQVAEVAALGQSTDIDRGLATLASIDPASFPDEIQMRVIEAKRNARAQLESRKAEAERRAAEQAELERQRAELAAAREAAAKARAEAERQLEEVRQQQAAAAAELERQQREMQQQRDELARAFEAKRAEAAAEEATKAAEVPDEKSAPEAQPAPASAAYYPMHERAKRELSQRNQHLREQALKLRGEMLTFSPGEGPVAEAIVAAVEALGILVDAINKEAAHG